MRFLPIIFLLMAAAPPDIKIPKLRSTMMSGKNKIEFISECQKKNGKYLYTYTFRNTGKQGLLVSNSVISRAEGLGDTSALIFIEQAKSVTITILHKDSPKEFLGVMRCYAKTSKFHKEWRKERDINSNAEQSYYFIIAGSVSGYIPHSLIIKLE